jgi:hypothetical protein
MKKLVLTSVCTLAVAGAALAQGTVNWSGPSFSYYTTQTNSQTYSPLFGGGSTGSGAVGVTAPTSAGGSFYFELLYTAYSGSGNGFAGVAASPSTLTQLATWSDSGLGGTQGTVGGRNSVSTANGAQVIQWPQGTTDSVMLVEWSGNLGTTWATALATLQSSSALQALLGQNVFFGESNTGYINPSTSTTSGATLFGNASQGTAGTPILSLSTQLYLVPVPEPSTIAMAAFGGLSLLALRRKK